MITLEGIPELMAAAEGISERIPGEMFAAVAEAGAKTEAEAKRRAPVVTGTLRRGIRSDPVVPWGDGGWQTSVQPTIIYSRRIELGFHGTDRLGRRYDQMGHPFFMPAGETVAAQLPAISAAHLRLAIGL